VTWTNAFIEQNSNMFKINTTQITYQAVPQNVTYQVGNSTLTTTTTAIVQSTRIVTIDLSIFLEFLIYLVVYFIVPIVGPLLYIFKWSKGG